MGKIVWKENSFVPFLSTAQRELGILQGWKETQANQQIAVWWLHLVLSLQCPWFYRCRGPQVTS